MSDVTLAIKKVGGDELVVNASAEVAREIGKRLVHTFNEYPSARLKDKDGNPTEIIDKDIPDWTTCGWVR